MTTGARERRERHDTTDRHDPVTSLLTRTTRTTGTGLTIFGEFSVGTDGSGTQGDILALCRRPIRSRGSVR
jgi:hypothetical protein